MLLSRAIVQKVPRGEKRGELSVCRSRNVMKMFHGSEPIIAKRAWGNWEGQRTGCRKRSKNPNMTLGKSDVVSPKRTNQKRFFWKEGTPILQDSFQSKQPNKRGTSEIASAICCKTLEPRMGDEKGGLNAPDYNNVFLFCFRGPLEVLSIRIRPGSCECSHSSKSTIGQFEKTWQ